MSDEPQSGLHCPLPQTGDEERITLAHGEGGRLSRRLVREHILSRLGNVTLSRLGDSAIIPVPGQAGGGRPWGDVESTSTLAFTTDSYTVSPLFFPGGDIGQLAVFGTVNDLAVSGAIPRWLSLGLILEEGLPISVLDRVLDSLHTAADVAGVEIVTGDTKVVPRGAADGLYINMAGVGLVLPCPPPGPEALQPGDKVLVSGPLGGHGAAILCAREQLGFDPSPRSDCAPLLAPLKALFESGFTPRAVRDATRGGLAAVLQEWTEASNTSCTLVEDRIPVSPAVRAVCELLGLEALHLANEGTFVLATPPEAVTATLEILRRFDITRTAVVIGEIGPSRRTAVSILRVSGREVAVDEPAGAPLPRIC